MPVLRNKSHGYSLAKVARLGLGDAHRDLASYGVCHVGDISIAQLIATTAPVPCIVTGRAGRFRVEVSA